MSTTQIIQIASQRVDMKNFRSLFSFATHNTRREQIIYNNKNYSTEEERNKFFDKIKTKQKTELCKHYAANQECPHKENCSFAHGEAELRNSNPNFQGYKTKICKLFHEDGICLFGARCNYIHRVFEKRYFNYSYLNYILVEKVYSELMKYENLNKEPWNVYRLILAKKQICW